MAIRGRKPKATTLKVLSGSRIRPIGNAKVIEPVPDGDLEDFAAPDFLTETQLKIWRHAIDNAPRGLLRNLDCHLLLIWVTAADLHQRASKAVSEEGMIVETPTQKIKQQSPYLPIINKQAEVMMRSAAEMGFSPTSRTRITLGNVESKKPTNRFSENKKQSA